MKKILLIEHCNSTALELQRHLESESFVVDLVSFAKDLNAIVNGKTFDLIIFNPAVMRGPKYDPVQWVGSYFAKTKVLLLGDNDRSCNPKPANVIAVVSYPINCGALTRLIKSNLNIHSYRGEIGDTGLKSYLRLICRKRVSKAIRVSHHGENGILLLKDGRISFAMKDNVFGDRALLDILSWKQGSFQEVSVKRFPPSNIDTTSQLLTGSDILSHQEEPENSLIEANAIPGASPSKTKKKRTQ